MSRLDPAASETLRLWVRYIKDDARIAAYLHIPVSEVRKARKRIPRNLQPGPARQLKTRAEPCNPADTFAAMVRSGSQKLAEAIERSRRPS